MTIHGVAKADKRLWWRGWSSWETVPRKLYHGDYSEGDYLQGEYFQGDHFQGDHIWLALLAIGCYWLLAGGGCWPLSKLLAVGWACWTPTYQSSETARFKKRWTPTYQSSGTRRSKIFPTTLMFWVSFLTVPEWCCCYAGLGHFPDLCPPNGLLLFLYFLFMPPYPFFLLCRRKSQKTQNSKTIEKTHLEH